MTKHQTAERPTRINNWHFEQARAHRDPEHIDMLIDEIKRQRTVISRLGCHFSETVAGVLSDELRDEAQAYRIANRIYGRVLYQPDERDEEAADS